MRQAPDFGQILDDKLGVGAFAWASLQDRAAQRPWNPGPRPVFLYGVLGDDSPRVSAPAAAGSGASPWTPVYGAGREARPSRAARTLTAAQHGALEILRRLGASSLAEDFTDAEARSAFRALARRFHPDRHPGVPDARRAELAKSFAAACDAYRTLTTPVH